MERILSIYTDVLITLIGFVLPAFAVTLSVFSDGLRKLKEKITEETKSVEEQLPELLEQSKKEEKFDKLEKLINERKAIKKANDSKIHYLSPLQAISSLGLPSVLSLVSWASFLFYEAPLIKVLFLIVSFTGFIYALYVLYKLFNVLTEVKNLIDNEKSEINRNTIDLLKELVSLTSHMSDEGFLTDVHIKFSDKKITDDNSSQIEMMVGKENEATVCFVNLEKRMAKNVEIGFIIPNDFEVSRSASFSYYEDEKDLIVRKRTESVHANTSENFDSLNLTPLKSGEYKIKTFIKAENIKSIYRTLTVNVI